MSGWLFLYVDFLYRLIAVFANSTNKCNGIVGLR